MFIVPIILAITVAITGFFSYQKQQDYLNNLEQKIEQTQNLGSYYAVGGKYYKLWGSGMDSDDTSVVLTSFKSPINDQEFTMSNFGEVGYGTIEPENVSNIEFISFTGITQDSSTDKATLTGVARGLNFVYPYTASTTLAKSHAGGSRFIISNPPMHYAEYPARKNTESIWGDWTYSATNTPQYNEAPSFTSASNEFASVKLVEDTANQGAATSTENQSGVVELVNSSELGQTNATGTSGSYLVLQNRFATSTGEFATSSIPVTGSDGKLSQNFYDLTEDWTFTGDMYFNGSTTIGNAQTDNLTVNASTTFTASTTFSSNSGTTTFNNGVLFNSTSTRFSVFPTIQATPTDQYHVATKSYVDSNTLEHFSVWPDSFSNTSGAWTDFNVSTSTGFATSTHVEVLLSSGTTGQVGVRENGSTADRRFPVFFTGTSWEGIFIVKVDENQLIDVYSNDGNDYWRIIGYWK